MEDYNLKFSMIEKQIKEIKESVKKLPTVDAMELANERLIKQIAESIDEKYVSKESFKPVQKVVYGLVGVILTSFMSGIIYFIFKFAR